MKKTEEEVDWTESNGTYAPFTGCHSRPWGRQLQRRLPVTGRDLYFHWIELLRHHTSVTVSCCRSDEQAIYFINIFFL